MKFSPTHVCAKKRQLYLIEGEEDPAEDANGGVEAELEGAIIKISIHAFNRSSNLQTMQVQGFVGKRRLQIMIDPGGTLNFVDK